jgi:tripartite-type tricarboxylate transporter receptor subunit TctC
MTDGRRCPLAPFFQGGIAVKTLILSLMVGIASLVAQVAPAQQYPTKPIRLILSFPPGGGVDFMARQVAQKMGENMGQPVVVDNRSGGNTIISADIAAHSPADGYTLFLALDFTMTQNPSLYLKRERPHNPR